MPDARVDFDMNILVLGETGQLARSLQDSQPAGLQVEYLSRDQCDLASAEQIKAALDAIQPDWVINAAAYTAVDKAEEEQDLANAINAEAPRAMAEWIAGNLPDQNKEPTKLIHISTDFVFDGTGTAPYKPSDPTDPLGAYGLSKLNGEIAIQEAAPEQSMIIRTAWVYSEHGNNFVKTMLRLMAERDELNVVNDQRGTPTYARDLAEIIWLLVTSNRFMPGTYHWSGAGEISWYEFATAIQAEALKNGLLTKPIPIKPIPASDYPTPAKRPAYSVLNTSDLEQVTSRRAAPWRQQLIEMLRRL